MLDTLKQISNWPLYKIWFYAIYSINLSQVFVFLQCKHQSMGLQKENTCSCTKPFMRNGLSVENSVWLNKKPKGLYCQI